MRHFLNLSDIAAEDLRQILSEAHRIKKAHLAGETFEPLRGKTLAMIFEKNSTRTRISFEVAMRQLGGSAMYLSRSDLQLGRGESIADTARVISRYVDIIMIRSNYHETIEEFAANSTRPVINGLTNFSHPCQVMADVLTFEELRGFVQGAVFAWAGDANNVCNSMIHAAQKLGFVLKIAAPEKYWPDRQLQEWIKSNNAGVTFSSDMKTLAGADCVITDTWASMGDEEPEIKKRALQAYQVNADVMKLAKQNAIFMHCLPAYRGEEVSADVIDGAQSAVLDEAENRLHVQKAILLWCLGML